jgi:hypothetical protein
LDLFIPIRDSDSGQSRASASSVHSARLREAEMLREKFDHRQEPGILILALQDSIPSPSNRSSVASIFAFFSAAPKDGGRPR